MSKLRRSMPPEATMVFKGKIFEVWQWEQEMYDHSKHTFERLRRANSTQVIAVVNGKIAAQTQEQPDTIGPLVSLPGGQCGWDEEPLAAAKRELLEESGYASDDWELWREENPFGKIEWTIYTYIARHCVFKQEPQLDAGEKITNRLIGFDEFLSLADDPLFYSKELVAPLLRARFEAKEREKLHRLLFGRNN